MRWAVRCGAVEHSSARGVGLASAVGYALHAPCGALPQFAVGYLDLPAAIAVAAARLPYGKRLAQRLDGEA